MDEIKHALLAILAAAPITQSHGTAGLCAHCAAKLCQIVVKHYLLFGVDPKEWN